MDLYRALNADVPQLLFTVMHQSRPDVTVEDYLRMIVTLHKDVRDQFQAIEEELNLWLQKQYVEQAEEMVRKLQRLALLGEQVDEQQAKRVQEALMLDYRRLSSRIGSQGLVGVQGSGEEIIGEGAPTGSDLASNVAAGHESVSALGFLRGQPDQSGQPGRGALHESWLLFRGSVHYDILEHVLSSRIESFEQFRESVACVSFGMYELVYQIGEGLTAELRSDSVMQEVTLLFGQGTSQYGSLRQEVAALMEEVSEYEHLLHASFWHRKPALEASREREFVLRLRLSGGEQALQEITRAVAATGEVGEKTIVKEGKMLLGRRVV
jgi:cell fate (sporulation/competence/biofilm development) regulator YmcA (YheA/YmcA/DUF963 family)